MTLAHETIKNPTAFFKPGRIFNVRLDPRSSQLHTLVVVRARPAYSICLPLKVFQPGANMDPSTHAPISVGGRPVQLHPRESGYRLQEIAVHVEDGKFDLSPLGRIGVGKTYTVEHGVRVANVGTVDPGYLARLTGYCKV